MLSGVKSLSSGGVHLAAEFAGVMPADYSGGVTRRGRTVTAALPNPSDRLSVAAARLVAEERALMGSYGSCVPSRGHPKFYCTSRKGLLPVERMISHTLELAEINTAMERLAEGRAVRQIVCFE